ncbi:hypothetical protein [Maribacter aquivivus]|uniref:hypothetical protein n=1 Tax=Maribacter aquivivus TaxID=228958 RepID=UPI00249483FD|nr:hypothetical protein [Maribacter aquivivus]
MGEIKTPIKASIDSLSFIKELKKLQSDVKSLNEFNSKIRLINKKLGSELQSLKQLDAYLENETGFKNTTMAADSLNLKDDYMALKTAIRPAIESLLIDVLDNGIVVIKEEAKDIIKERNTPTVAPEFTETARRMLDFKKWYDGLGYQERHAFSHFQGIEMRVNLNALISVSKRN